MERFLGAEGALAMTAHQADLLIPPEDTGDSAYPSGTSATISLWLRLHVATGEDAYLSAVERVLDYYGTRLDNFPELWASAVAAVNAAVFRDGVALRSIDDTGVAARKDDRSVVVRVPDTAVHVRATAHLREVAGRDEIVVTLEIEDGYHVNANPASLDYLIPTSVRFDGNSPMRLSYPAPVRLKPSFSPLALDVYQGSASIVAIFPDGALEGAEAIAGTVTAQACNDRVCLPPADLPVTVAPAD